MPWVQSRSLISNPGVYTVVAEADGTIAGSNFMDERNPIAGIGPISVDPSVQNQSIGRQLMENVLERVRARNFAGVRLVQTAYHNRSLCLYTKLGFETREPLSVMQGKPLNLKMPGYDVRAARESDLDACNRLCVRVHGHHRGGELHDAISTVARPSSSGSDASPGTRRRSHSSGTRWAKATMTSARSSAQRRHFSAPASWCRRATGSCSDGASATDCASCSKRR